MKEILIVGLLCLLIAAVAEWLMALTENRRLSKENDLLTASAFAEAHDLPEAQVLKLQPHRGASRDRSLPGKDRVRARKALNRGQ